MASKAARPSPEAVAQVQALADRGVLIEAGFASLRKIALPPDAPAADAAEMRLAFFAGAQHLLASIIGILDPGVEEIPADLRRLDRIQDELERFRVDLAAQIGASIQTRGNA